MLFNIWSMLQSGLIDFSSSADKIIAIIDRLTMELILNPDQLLRFFNQADQVG